MKTISKLLAAVLLQISLTYGSGGPPPPLPFESAEITGPLHLAPLFISDTNNVTIFTQFSLFTTSSVDGYVDVEGTRNTFSSNQNRKNLVWNLSNAAFNLGIDIKFGKTFTLFTSIKFDNRENGITTTGSDFGFGLLFSPADNVRARWDFGLSYTSTDIKVNLLSITNNDTTYDVNTANDKGLDPFISLTMNTANNDWLINPFFQVSYCSQTLFSINNGAEDTYSDIALYTLTPGITYRLNENMMIIIGGRYIIPSNLENRLSPGVLSGFAQVNFLLWKLKYNLTERG